jgi:hypothetical protein
LPETINEADDIVVIVIAPAATTRSVSGRNR